MSVFLIEPGPLATQYQVALRRLEVIGFADALWNRRLDVWPGDAATHAVIDNRLGWLDATTFAADQIARLEGFAAAVRDDRYTDVVLLGMGGSSLAPEVLRRVLGVAPGQPRFRVLDSTDPAEVRDALATAATSLFILASKSGTTIEPLSMAAEASRRIEAAGAGPAGSRFVAITDAGTQLETRARAESFRDVFINPANIGGRFSALSLFGLVPAAAMGHDLRALLAPAGAMAERCHETNPAANPGLALGALMAAGALAGCDKLTLLLPPSLESLGLWIEQLVAESTGKAGVGVLPVRGEPETAPIGDDRVGVTLAGPNERADTLARRLRDAAAPMARLEATPATIGAEFFRWEVATTAAGWLLGLNPFDEPNVGLAKAATSALLARYEREGTLPAPEAVTAGEGVALAPSRAAAIYGSPLRVLDTARPGDYVAVLAYVPPSSPDWQAALERLRTAVARVTGCVTTVGFGPRYLHSTGQIHKGGADNGVFIVIAPAADDDLAIPHAPYSFGVLQQAQAIGDFQSLDGVGRRAILATASHRDVARLERALGTLVTP